MLMELYEISMHFLRIKNIDFNNIEENKIIEVLLAINVNRISTLIIGGINYMK